MSQTGDDTLQALVFSASLGGLLMPRIRKVPFEEGAKGLELTMQLRNNQLKRRRTALGLSQKDFAHRAGVSPSVYAGLEKLARSPGVIRDGKMIWTPTARKLADFYYVEPEDLWPRVVLAVKKPRVTRELGEEDIYPLLSGHQARSTASPEDLLIAQEDADRLPVILDSLGSRIRRILEERCGFEGEAKTQEEAGQEFGVGRGRVMQLEAKALRMLRHPRRAEALQPILDPDIVFDRTAAQVAVGSEYKSFGDWLRNRGWDRGPVGALARSWRAYVGVLTAGRSSPDEIKEFFVRRDRSEHAAAVDMAHRQYLRYQQEMAARRGPPQEG